MLEIDLTLDRNKFRNAKLDQTKCSLTPFKSILASKTKIHTPHERILVSKYKIRLCFHRERFLESYFKCFTDFKSQKGRT